MYKTILSALLLVLLLSCSKEDKTVHLKGELINFGQEVFMSKGTPEGKLLKEGVTIKLDEQNRFDVTFKLTEPAYFRLGRNTLYLSPGDNLELTCDLRDPMAGQFTGQAANACLYLRAKPFPKGGSFLQGGMMIKDNPSFDEVLSRLEQKVKERQKELNAVQNISERFKNLENGRIMFGAANTLMSYAGYAAWMKKLPEDEIKSFEQKASEYFKPSIKKYLEQGNNADFLNIDVYRDICYSCVEILGEDKMDQKVLDYIQTSNLLYYLSRQGPVAKVYEQKKEIAKKIKDKTFIEVIEKSFEKYASLLPDQPAPELTFTTQEGTEVKLSDFKGKMVVMDVWATWCGPCKNESPHFEALAKKYQDKEIAFIAVSIDTNKKAWNNYITEHPKTSQQLITNRTVFADYQLEGVPRFMLIDKEGKFIECFAPAPSNPELEELIVKNL